jgi:hypothetical protein
LTKPLVTPEVVWWVSLIICIAAKTEASLFKSFSVPAFSLMKLFFASDKSKSALSSLASKSFAGGAVLTLGGSSRLPGAVYIVFPGFF